jgi:hypothetical protein
MAKGKAKTRRRTVKPIRIGNVTLSNGSTIEFEWRMERDGINMTMVWGEDTVLIPIKTWLDLMRSATSIMTDVLNIVDEEEYKMSTTNKNDVMFR